MHISEIERKNAKTNKTRGIQFQSVDGAGDAGYRIPFIHAGLRLTRDCEKMSKYVGLYQIMSNPAEMRNRTLQKAAGMIGR